MNEHDIFEQFMERERELEKLPAQPKPVTNNINTIETDLYDGTRTRVSKQFFPGRVVGNIRVVGRIQREGKYGPYTNGVYLCECLIKDEAGSSCGKRFEVPYQKLYYSAPYSCGCRLRPRRPPWQLEGQRFERIEVLRWDYEQQAWECVCHECARLLYRRNIHEIRALEGSCAGHEVEITPPLKRTRSLTRQHVFDHRE